jgi:hypothetical protein
MSVGPATKLKFNSSLIAGRSDVDGPAQAGQMDPGCAAAAWFCNANSILAELARLAQDGRSDNFRFVCDTQRAPNC